MIIISDASPLSALAEIGELELLRRLYHEVVIPETVRQECTHPHTPASLVQMLADSDSLFKIVPDPPLLPETLSVDPGEAAAISLAHDATLLTRNVADFKTVPGLRIKN